MWYGKLQFLRGVFELRMADMTFIFPPEGDQLSSSKCCTAKALCRVAD